MTSAIQRILAGSDLLVGLDDAARAQIIPELEPFRLRGGQLLFRQGEAGDCLYIVAYGRLRATIERDDGGEELVGEAGRGETVGEMALLTSEPRSATIRAARDSELYKLPADAFARLLERHPQATMQLARRIVARYLAAMRSRGARAAPSTIALVPTRWETPLSDFSHRLERALSTAGPVLRLNSDVVDAALGAEASQRPPDHAGAGDLLAWLNEQESRHRFVIYEADLVPGGWSRRCVRQADRVLVVASDEHTPEPGPLEAALYGEVSDAPMVRKELVLLHRQRRAVYPGTAAWLAHRPVAAHHHLGLDDEADVERLARFLTGRAMGVVLGGGGARSFAHIGVLRAIEEAGLAIDAVGGASMGAYMAAQYALGWDPERMRAFNREAWLRVRAMKDYTVPVVSILAGRGFRTIARETCGTTAIEDLGLPFFCVSSNLTRATLRVHQHRGTLWRAILASISVPGLLPPVNDEGDLLVDGAILDNVPIDVMRRLCDGPIIACDVSPREDLTLDPDAAIPQGALGALRRLRRPAGERAAPTIVDLLLRVSTLGSTIAVDAMRKQASVYIQPPTAAFTVVDWARVDELADAGHRAAATALAEWRERDALGKGTGQPRRRVTSTDPSGGVAGQLSDAREPTA